ncbi:Nucleotide-binding protein [bacterium HR15]|nr:Nucleotide-binding protein [bacterium HR15]
MAKAGAGRSRHEPTGQLVVLTGLSGAGKTLALQTLEDIGYFCIDNLPPSMLAMLFTRAKRGQRVAVVVDARAGEPLTDAVQTIQRGRNQRIPVEVLFLDCADEVLLRRFKETRRPHPLANSEWRRVDSEGRTAQGSLQDAITRERELLAPLREIADRTLDTTLFRPQDLREAIRAMYHEANAPAPLRLRIISFGYKYGIPADADLVFDVRFLRNPHYVPELQPRPGTDPAVQDYVLGDKQTQAFLAELERFLAHLLPQYRQEGKAYLTIGIGCTGGRHRSVVLANYLGEWFAQQGYRAAVEHRDLERGEE